MGRKKKDTTSQAPQIKGKDMARWLFDEGFKLADAKRAIDVIMGRLGEAIVEGNEIVLPEIGTIKTVRHAKHIHGGSVAQTHGIEYYIPQLLKVKFYPKKSFDLKLREKMRKLNPKEWEEYYDGIERRAAARGLVRREKGGKTVLVSEILDSGE